MCSHMLHSLMWTIFFELNAGYNMCCTYTYTHMYIYNYMYIYIYIPMIVINPKKPSPTTVFGWLFLLG